METAMRMASKSIDLISKKTNLLEQHTFWYISFPLFCTTRTRNFLVTNYVMVELSYVLTKNFVAEVFMFAFIFSLPLIFTLLATSLLAVSISHFLTAAIKFSCFASNQMAGIGNQPRLKKFNLNMILACDINILLISNLRQFGLNDLKLNNIS